MAFQKAFSQCESSTIAQVIGDGNIIVQLEAGRAHLTLKPLRKQLKTPRSGNELDLLSPGCRSLPYLGRSELLTDLVAWARGERRISIRTIAGSAGVGKTRTALELIDVLEQVDVGLWDAGFASRAELIRFANQQNLSSWGWRRPTLIVIDYAGWSAEPLKRWLDELRDNTHHSQSPLRILLLEREADPTSGWLHNLLDCGWSGTPVEALFDPPAPIHITPISSPSDRLSLFSQMLGIASQFLGIPQPPNIDAQGTETGDSFEAGTWGDPLYLSLAAIVALHEGTTTALSLSRVELAICIAERELRRIKGFASEGSELHRVTLAHLAAYVAVCGGLSRRSLLNACVEEMNELAVNIEGGPGGMKALLTQAIGEHDSIVQFTMPDIIQEGIGLVGTRQAGYPATVIRAFRRYPNQVAEHVTRVIQDYSYAGYNDPALALHSLIKSTDELSLLFDLQGMLPRNSVVLREHGVALCEALISRLKRVGEVITSIENTDAVAWATADYAVRLLNLDRVDEAVHFAKQAHELREQLLREQPTSAYLISAVATSCQNLAVMCQRASDPSASLRYGERASTLYESIPIGDDVSGPFALAMAWNTRGAALEALSRTDEATEAFFRAVNLSIGPIDADDKCHRGLCLTSLVHHLVKQGRESDARTFAWEALTMFEALYASSRDEHAHEFALSIENYASVLSDEEVDEYVHCVRRALNIRIRHCYSNATQAELLVYARRLAWQARRLSILGMPDDQLFLLGAALDLHSRIELSSISALPRALCLEKAMFALASNGRANESIELGIAWAEEFDLSSGDASITVAKALCYAVMGDIFSRCNMPDEGLEHVEYALNITQHVPPAWCDDAKIALFAIGGCYGLVRQARGEEVPAEAVTWMRTKVFGGD